MEDVRRLPLSHRARDLGYVRLVGALAVALIVLVVAWRAPGAVHGADTRARELAAMPEDERDFLGARSADVDTRIYVLAAAKIARDETYAVITGDKVGVSTPNTLYAVGPFARYYLLPRRQTPEPTAADWIISFGGDLDALHLTYAERDEVSPGIELARVAR
jgi:hypothetical protein